MDVNEILSGFYADGGEDGRLISKVGAVEFIVTTAYIDKYIKPGDRVFEIGCGTGRYTLHYAAQGYEVDALELLECNLEVLQSRVTGENVRAVQGNATDLSAYPDETFDVTLLLGPMYHLFTDADKHKALSEAVRVTKRDGVLFAAYCQFDASMVQNIFSDEPMYDAAVENGLLDPQTLLPISTPAGVFELYRRDQIDLLDAQISADRLHYVGTDMFAHYCEQSVDALPERLYKKYIEYTLSVCERPELVGVSNHVLDVLKKR